MTYKILIDSREQKPYAFKGETTKTVALKTGDYSIEVFDKDCSDEIVIERKALGDFISCICQQRERFIKELERSMAIPHFFIIIEADWKEIEVGNYYSKINPNSVIESILGWQIKYGCNIILSGNRTRGQRLAKKILIHYLKYKTLNKKEKKKVKSLNDSEGLSRLL
jgi:DNA excision repair protein ERCC-4